MYKRTILLLKRALNSMETDKEDTDFYLQLHSTSSQLYFPHNTPGEFENYFGKVFALPDDEWRVGLATITFDHEWNNASPVNATIVIFRLSKRPERRTVAIPAGYYPSPHEICKALNREMKMIG